MSSTSADPQPVVDGRGGTILGPRNLPIEQQNPDVLIAPVTDAGTVPNFKWPFALSHNRVLSGGWARETTTRELPISTEIAGVNMRLTPTAGDGRRRPALPSDPAATGVHVAHARSGADQDPGRADADHRLAQPSRSLSGSRRRWSRSSQVGCASCTGTPTRTSGSTTSRGRAG